MNNFVYKWCKFSVLNDIQNKRNHGSESFTWIVWGHHQAVAVLANCVNFAHLLLVCQCHGEVLVSTYCTIIVFFWGQVRSKYKKSFLVFSPISGKMFEKYNKNILVQYNRPKETVFCETTVSFGVQGHLVSWWKIFCWKSHNGSSLWNPIFQYYIISLSAPNIPQNQKIVPIKRQKLT